MYSSNVDPQFRARVSSRSLDNICQHNPQTPLRVTHQEKEQIKEFNLFAGGQIAYFLFSLMGRP